MAVEKQNQDNSWANHKRKITSIFSQPWTDVIYEVFYLLSQTNAEPKQN